MVLLLRRLEHGVAAAHEQEAGVAQIGRVQLALIRQAPQDARRRGALDLDPTDIPIEAEATSAAVNRVSRALRSTFRKRLSPWTADSGVPAATRRPVPGFVLVLLPAERCVTFARRGIIMWGTARGIGADTAPASGCRRCA